jgi:hypothetical protein
MDDAEAKDSDLFVFVLAHQKPSFRMCFVGYKSGKIAWQKHCWVGSLKTDVVLHLNDTADRYDPLGDQALKSSH